MAHQGVGGQGRHFFGASAAICCAVSLQRCHAGARCVAKSLLRCGGLEAGMALKKPSGN